MPLDLIAFDLDGTTLDSEKTISPGNYRALRRAHLAGVRLVPCTGRSLHELPAELNGLIDEFGFTVFPYMITDNGAQVYDPPGKKQLFARGLSEKTALAILAEGRRRPALTYASFGIGGATDNRGMIWDAEEARPFIAEYEQKWKLPAANLEDLIKWNCGAVKMSMNLLSGEDCEKARAEFSTWPGLTLSSAAENNIEFMTEGICKGEALRFISGHSGVPPERIMAIGDNHNDMEMIRGAGFGVAMGNAIPELKEAARWVTASNDEDGLALAIEKMLAEW
ncbi:MAG: Cof-type HAD-IIB family hydrolase [Treponema sp.]|jgi:Cof subfamily protein (haloacid dehalogenase superfamily)|nr:Cof-type HAD-IIB family hydrolase [Treponema sp.]